MKLNRVFLVALPAMALTACPQSQKKETVRKQPNFLFILTDDQPYDALGIYDRYPFLKTPNMDKLAMEGVNFTNYFVTQSICSPSRASFLTGTFPHIHGVNQNNPKVDPDWNSYPSYNSHLHNAGYETAFIGKIHMAHFKGEKHIRPGYDYWYSFIGQGDFFDPMVNDNGSEYQEIGYMTDILTEKAIDWLRDKRDKSKSFSLCLWHKAIHEPHTPAPRHEGLYASENLPEPPHGMHKETFLGKPEWQRRKAIGKNWREHLPIPNELDEQNWPIKEEKFMNMLECLLAVDESLGKVLTTLKEEGELENTVVIFSSDNGYFMGEHTYHDKRIAYESSMRIPMIIRYPQKIEQGSEIDALCMNIDLAPTILEMAGVEVPEYMQGKSMLDLMEQKDENWRKSILFEYYVDDAYPYAGPDMLAVITDSFKLVDNFIEGDIDELYDLKQDPGEMNNLISDLKYSEVEKKLREQLIELKKEYEYNPDRDWWLRQVIQNPN
ncbi:MAG: sulfatase [Bacteroidales bacterium]|nr:sulfatase [Bacteroidales bacterium]MCF8405363.1 sulfatase [Bacteroidales bacterium]